MAKAKGTGPVSMGYAAGGPVTGRVRNFMKEKDEFRDPDEANATADADQLYAKQGKGEQGKDKSLKAVKPRK